MEQVNISRDLIIKLIHFLNDVQKYEFPDYDLAETYQKELIKTLQPNNTKNINQDGTN